MPQNTFSRRTFLAAAAAAAGNAAAAANINTARVAPRKISPNEKLNIAGIGVGGFGRRNLEGCNTENIVALCDVDFDRAGRVFETYPNARRYRDFRKMFDAEANNIDAVIVATPDHTHAVAAMAAMKMGKHVYCQKPIAHNIYEVRKLAETARECKVQTQMGNQGHSMEGPRRVCEMIADGAIGRVREVHAWTDRPVGGSAVSHFPIMKRTEETAPVPESLDWDLWLGPAPFRPYNPIYHPTQWRAFRDFGTGPLGDMGCHILDPAFWSLNLGHPESVQATTTHYDNDVAKETYPRASVVRYQFPARGEMPPVNLTWYDGRLLPPVPEFFDPRQRFDSNGAIILGEKGAIMHGTHGASDLRLLPRELADEYREPPKTLPRIPDNSHEQDWVRACKGGEPACSNFDYSGTLTEMVLLGVLAMHVKNRRLEWDPQALRITNDEEADALIRRPYRDGWTL